MSKVYNMSNNLVNITPVTDSSTLGQAHQVSRQLDSASDAITGMKGCIYSRVRRVARDVYEAHSKRALETSTELSFHAMRAEFKSVMDAEDGGDSEGTWGQYKANFGRALGLGFDFIAVPEVAQSALTKWMKNIEEEAVKAEDAKAKAAYLKDHGLTDAKAKPDAPDSNVTGGDKAKGATTAPKGNTAPDGANTQPQSGIQFKDAVQKAAFDKMIELMAEISTNDPAELDGMINGAVTQLTAKAAKIMKAAMKIAV